MRRRIGSIAIVLLATAVGLTAYAGPPVVVGQNVPAAQRIPAERIDHSAWDMLLKKYVDEQGMVDYRKWQATPADMQALDAYLDHLSTATLTADAEMPVQLAFWINAYNALTVKGILREYPTTSIKNHTSMLFGYNIWDDLQLLIAGQPYSLNTIEHKILRPMGKPRIHFTIVCASIGCPRLLNQAYVPEKIDEQLAVNTRAFFADPSKFQFDVARKTIAVSPILKWFSGDFGKNSAAVQRRISPWLPEGARQLAASGEARVSYLEYDWGLNDQAMRRQASR